MFRTGMSRRGVLRGALAALAVGPAAACQRPAPRWPDGTEMLLRPVFQDAMAAVDRYRRAIESRPGLAGRLVPLRADHEAHAEELGRILGTGTPSSVAATPSPAPDTESALVAALASAEREAQQRAADACLRAPGRYAGLLGSITACRASHVEALS